MGSLLGRLSERNIVMLGMGIFVLWALLSKFVFERTVPGWTFIVVMVAIFSLTS